MCFSIHFISRSPVVTLLYFSILVLNIRFYRYHLTDISDVYPLSHTPAILNLKPSMVFKGDCTILLPLLCRHMYPGWSCQLPERKGSSDIILLTDLAYLWSLCPFPGTIPASALAVPVTGWALSRFSSKTIMQGSTIQANLSLEHASFSKNFPHFSLHYAN